MKGGAERIIAAKANYFSTTMGYDVTIVSIYKDDREYSYPLDEGVKFVRLNVPFARKTGGEFKRAASKVGTYFKALFSLDKFFLKKKPNVVFFTTTLGALLLPFCITWGKRVFESHSARIFTPYNKFFILAEYACNALVCLTEGDADEYVRARNIKVIPNFIEAPTSFVTDYSVKRAIAVGRLEPVKGFDRLIVSWKEILKECPDWKLDIWGEGSLKQDLQKQIDDLGLADSVKLCGRSDNIMEVYPHYSLHLMPSHYEGMPMALIEAQACGLPSVAYDFKYGAKDVISDLVTGLLAPQDYDADFEGSAIRLMQDEPRRTKYGLKAVEVASRFTKEEVMGKWIRLINSL